MSIVGHFRMNVPAAVAKPSPSIGQCLGQLGINMVAFCKEFNARTPKVRPEVPLQVTLIPFTDNSWKFYMRSPPVHWFTRRVARSPRCGDKGLNKPVSNITLKEVYHIAKVKQMDPQNIGVPIHVLCRSIIGTCRAQGILVTKDLLPQYINRDDVPVRDLDALQKLERQRNKSQKRKGK
eukprot:CAMPEP_0204326878 /NCGR_PEP_ID=MMETSP0469-20131031/12167_1 /ASSEMBLY_ACC=CAM_ASM_000384 /TAXON_ID=2969 /ORGANISM="Oxyrrhis marina" /LENGTH=178 /DNA_ID=CAMNT_0051309017 /DNA_START=5 /DNA_END=541 /DNA_ORIENTATION=+